MKGVLWDAYDIQICNSLVYNTMLSVLHMHIHLYNIDDLCTMLVQFYVLYMYDP